MSRIAEKMPTSYTEAKAMLKGNTTKKIAHNTYLRLDGAPSSEQIAIQYHNTRIVTFFNDGSIMLQTRGWQTSTTKGRMNGALRGSGYSLFQKAGAWYVRQANGETMTYEEGMMLQPAKPEMTTYGACAIIEGFSGGEPTEEETLDAWQHLIDTGDAWRLQGFYGRTARDLIDAGYCTEAR